MDNEKDVGTTEDTFTELASSENGHFLIIQITYMSLNTYIVIGCLQNVPQEVVELDLAICLLDDNFLVTLPTALKEMDGLSVLTASNNMMRIFPYNLFPLHEFALDLSNNPFTSRYFVIPDRPQKYEPPSLKELAARTVVDYR
ncbi:uncharacterized protein LOC124771147 [Schistocerca piceifrons]|uniref:uncharacterized protein LOC124722147 n=1 Tax=Schistocerca piceifrons TaxID=274613 RepID=UPI001F5F0A93|nr:uncharacterized protein LOC124722147 [Schistocerca piceifrons]XP_047105250.1 uncharacterized protein LOC124771147 [Schistocerca piceifrons]